MNKLLLIAAFLPATLFAQSEKVQVRKQIAPAVMVFAAGMADGFVETISHNYKGFKRAFPGAKDYWFDPGMSFRNKYKNSDPKQGAKFPGSTGPLVFLTDGYHAGRFAEHLFLAGAFAVKITQQKQRWWYYLAEGAAYWIVNRIGFYAVYSIILK